MKKTFIFVLSAVMMFSLMTGCKELPVNEDSTSEGTEQAELIPEKNAVIKFKTGDREFGLAVADKFTEKYPDVKVEVEDGGMYDYQKLMLELPSGNGPDVFMSPHDKTTEGIQAGLYYEIDKRIVERLNSEINSVAMKTVTVDDVVYGVPVSIETYVLFYNKDLVKGEPVKTFEDLKAQCLNYNNEQENKFWYLGEVGTGSPLYTMISTYGFNLFGENGTDEDNPGFETEEFKKGLDVVKAYKEIMPISAGDLGNTDFLTTQFITGKTAYLMGGPWNIKYLREDNVNFGVTPLPTFDGHQQRSFAFVQNAHVSAYTKYPIASQLFAEFLISNQSAELLYEKAAKVTSRADITTVNGLKDDEQFSAIAKAFDTSIPMPSAKRISYFWTIAGNIGPAVFDGQMTINDAIKKAKADWESFLLTE